MTKPSKSWPAPAIWAHRGASAAHPENTVAAFAAAAAMGADGVELDVRRTADATLAVSHDARLADGRLLVELTAAELPAATPTLEDALDACDALAVNIEVKNFLGDADFEPTEAVARAVAALVVDRGIVTTTVVSSFSFEVIEAVRRAAPEIAIGYLTSPRADQYAELERAAAAGCRALHPHHLVVNPALVAAAHEAGLAVNTWTCDDPDRLRWLAAAGVDAVVTNMPDVARAALHGERS